MAGLVFMVFHRNERAEGAVRIPPKRYIASRGDKSIPWNTRKEWQKSYPAQQIPAGSAKHAKKRAFSFSQGGVPTSRNSPRGVKLSREGNLTPFLFCSLKSCFSALCVLYF